MRATAIARRGETVSAALGQALKDFARRNRFLILMRKNTEDLRLKGSEHRSSGHRCEAIYERLRNHLRLYCLLALESDDEIGKAAVAATSFQGGNWKGVEPTSSSE